MKKTPKEYVDCVIKHSDGSVRIGRLNHDKTFWQLAAYRTTTKHNYCWSAKDVISWKEIDTTI